MSITNLSVGIGAVSGFLVLVVGAIAPKPAPIQVHSLEFDGGIVHQERTVITDGETFFAWWRAEVVDAATGDPVPQCSGGGDWPYVAGYRVVDVPLGEWVGRPEDCTLDDLPDQFYLRASWFWGDDQTNARSVIYTR
jgi:hypothetical protein